MSCVTKKIGQSCGDIRWRVCYQRGPTQSSFYSLYREAFVFRYISHFPNNKGRMAPFGTSLIHIRSLQGLGTGPKVHIPRGLRAWSRKYVMRRRFRVQGFEVQVQVQGSEPNVQGFDWKVRTRPRQSLPKSWFKI